MSRAARTKKERRGRVGIRWWLFACLALFTILILVSIWIFQVCLLSTFYEKEKFSDLKKSADELKEYVAAEDARNAIAKYAKEKNICILVIALEEEHGRLLASADATSDCIIHHVNAQTLEELYADAKQNGGTYNKRFEFNDESEAEGEGRFPGFPKKGSSVNAIHVRIVEGNGVEYVMLLDCELMPVDATVRTLQMQFVWIAGALLCCAFLLALLLSHIVAKPLVQITQKAEKLAGGEFKVDFSERDAYREVQELAAGYEKCGEFLTDTRVKTDFAMIASTTTDYLMKQQSVTWEDGAHQWETAYTRRLMRIYDAIAASGIRPDVLTPMGSFDKYRILFTPFLMTLEEENLQARITAWVERGGIWIAGPMTDIRDSIGTHYTDRETGILEKITGAQLVQQVPDAEHRIPCRWTDGGEFKAEKWLQLYEVPADVRVLATAEGYHSALVGKALVFEKKLGKGSILVLGTEPSAEDAARLIREAVGLQPQFQVEGEVAAARRTGTNMQGIAAQEYGGKPGKLFLNGSYTDLITGKTWDHEIPLAPYQTVILRKDG